jgi:hypothetical protein
MLQKYQLKLYPQFSGKVVREKTSAPVDGCSLWLRGPVDRQARCDRFGRFSVRLAPGEYRLTISEHLPRDPRGVSEQEDFGWTPPAAMIWAGGVTVADDGLRRDFRVSSAVKLTVTVTFDARASKDVKPAYLTAIRIRDGAQACNKEVLKDGQKPTTICASEGSYRLLVFGLGKEWMAGWAGEFNIKPGARGPIKVQGHVREWKYFTRAHDGRVRLLDEKPEPQEHR